MTKLILPEKIEGSFWLTDELENNNNIINIESQNDTWMLKANSDAKIIYNNSYINSVAIKSNNIYNIEYNGNVMTLITEERYDNSINYYKINKDQIISLGNTKGNIIYKNSSIFDDYMKLTFLGNNSWKISIQQKSKIFFFFFYI